MLMLVSKMGLQLGFEALHLNPFVAYALVHTIVFFLSFALQVGFTFKHTLSLGSLAKYFRMVILFKAIDYAVFAGVFGFFEISSPWAIVVATLFLFLIRFNALHGCFSNKPPPVA